MKPLPLSETRKQVAVLARLEGLFDAVVLFALAELGVIRALAEGPVPFDGLHCLVGGDPTSLRATLDAAVALGWLEKSEGGYRAGADVLDCLGDPASPTFLGDWVAFVKAVGQRLFSLGDMVRRGAPAGPDVEGQDEVGHLMTRAMDAYARSRGVELADHLDLAGTTTLLDLGCGAGTYSIAIAQRHPDLAVTLLDRPGPIEQARRRAREEGLLARFRFVAGDALDFQADQAFDAVLISNVLHTLGPARSKELLCRCFPLLRPGGQLMVQAQFLDPERVSPRWAVLLNLIQRVTTVEGQNHTVDETIAWMAEAGFSGMRHLPLSLWNVCSCVVGRR